MCAVLFFGTDPVALDTVAHDFIVQKRVARETQQVASRGPSVVLQLAGGPGLGVSARDKIEIADVS